MVYTGTTLQNFNPLPPHGGRQFRAGTVSRQQAFQSTPSAWRETSQTTTASICTAFQSTPSAWRETISDQPSTKHSLKISIHSLRMEGDELCCFPAVSAVVISIHSLRMEGDPFSEKHSPISDSFQSTPSAWRETKPPAALPQAQ